MKKLTLMTYSGNRMASVSDAAPAVTQTGSLDFAGGSSGSAFGYNGFGALTSDASRGITSITYDDFGNPLKISYSDGSSTQNVYSATGEKLKSTHTTVFGTDATMARTIVVYRGPAVYIDGKLYMVLFPGGYASVATNGTVTFHYYTQDYLGNNRAVVNGSTGLIEQTTAYYPYGAVIAGLGTSTVNQPYKFGGKELMTANGLNEYDFGARQYWSSVPCFTRIDPMAEKYTWLSPYLYCANNPIMLIDKDGQEPVYSNSGVFLGVDENGLQGNPIVMDPINFKNGMSHEEAIGFICNPISKKAQNKIKIHHASLSQRPDYDGIVTIEEGIIWAKSHPNAIQNPTPDNMLYIDTSKLDFGPLSVADFKSPGTEETIDLFGSPVDALVRSIKNPRYKDTVYALGRCNMKLLDRNSRRVIVINNSATDYDWNGGGSNVRKFSIFLNNLWYGINNNVHGFKTFYYGIGKLNQ